MVTPSGPRCGSTRLAGLASSAGRNDDEDCFGAPRNDGEWSRNDENGNAPWGVAVSALYQRINQRNFSDRSHVRIQFISHTVNRLNQFIIPPLVYFISQFIDKHI